MGKGREILFASVFVQAVGYSVFPFLTSPGHFVLVVSLVGVFISSFIPVFTAVATWASSQYGRAIGGFWFAASLGFGSATLLGGFIYEFWGQQSLFVLGAVYGYVGCVSVLLVNSQGFTRRVSTLASQGYFALLRQKQMLVLCSISILAVVATSAFNGFFTLYLVDVLGGSRLMAGLAATATTVLGALAFRLVGPLNDAYGRKPIFLLGTVCYAAYFATIYFVTNTLLATILWVLPIYPFIQSSAVVLASDYTSESDRGKGLGLLQAALGLGAGLGPLAGGLIADTAGLKQVILFSLSLALASTLSSQYLLKERLVLSGQGRKST